MASKTAVILNPRAAGGRSAKQLPLIERELNRRLDHPVDVLLTERPGQAADLTRKALTEGCDLIVAVGGDGTANEIVNGWFTEETDQPIRPEARLGFIPIGTGCDLRRTLNVPRDIGAAAEVIARGRAWTIDVGKASLVSHDGAPISRYFVNVVSFGMGGDVSVRAKNFLSDLSGKAAFLYATAAVFFTYRGKRVRLTLDGQQLPEALDVTNVAVGNGRYHGGGMHPCPRAAMDDGLLEVTTIRHLTTFEFIRDLPVLYSDDIYRHPKVDHYHATRLRAESEEITRIEIDGEGLGMLPLEIELLSARLRVLVPADSPRSARNVGLG